jgi:hypothetical protein
MPDRTQDHTQDNKAMVRIAVLLVVIGGALVAGPALAQYGGGGFDDQPPRPPGDIPNGPFPPQPPPVGYPGSAPPSYPPYSAAPPPSGVQAQSLPPPPGATAAPPPARVYPPRPPSPPPERTRLTPPPANPGGPANPAAPANPPAAQPAEAAPPESDDTVVIERPTEKIENARAVFSGLDKITGRTISFDAAIGETVKFGLLEVTPRACYTRPPTEPTNTDAFVEVDEVTLKREVKRIFTGWMFASSPGLNAVEHPIYDVWLTDCKAPLPTQAAEVAPPPAPPAPVVRPRQPPRAPVRRAPPNQ